MDNSSNIWLFIGVIFLTTVVGFFSMALFSVQVPTDITTTFVTSSEISLSWKGKGTFLIYRSIDDGKFREIAETSSNHFLDKSLKPDTTYRYFLKTKYLFFTSKPSKIFSVTTKYDVCGYVRSYTGKGISNVQILVENHNEYTTSDSKGYWCLKNLSGSNDIMAFKKRYIFSPKDKIINGPEENVIFNATLINKPPNFPKILNPANNASNLSTSLTLKWKCSDPNGDRLKYTVYFGKGHTLEAVATSISSTFFEIKHLNYGTTYHWRIEAFDPYGASSKSEIWTFTTRFYNVSGRVTYGKNKNEGLKDVKVSINGTKAVFTSKNGYFSIGSLRSSNLVKAYKKGWNFSPKVMRVDGPSSRINFFGKPIDGTILWKILNTQFVFSSPALSKNGILYFGTLDGNFYAINPEGKVLWKFSTGRWIWSSPAIGKDGTIYFASDDGFIYALYQNGKEKWKRILNGLSFSSPAVDENENVYIGNKSGDFYSMDKSGKIRWVKDLNGEINSSPAIGEDETIYIGTEKGMLYAISIDGTVKWKYKAGGGIFSSPAIGEDGNIYFCSSDGYLHALKQNGIEKWKIKVGRDIYASPIIDKNGNIYVGSDNGFLYAVGKNGEIKWKFKVGDMIVSTPVIGKNGIIYVCSKNGFLYAVSENGREIWFKRLKGMLFYSSPNISSKGVMYLGTFGVFAIQTDSFGMGGIWPKFRLNSQNTSDFRLKKR